MTSMNENEKAKGTFLVMESAYLSSIKLVGTKSPTLPSSPASPTYIHCNSSDSFDMLNLRFPTEDMNNEILSSSPKSSSSASLEVDTKVIVKVPLATASPSTSLNNATNSLTAAEKENQNLNLHLGLPFEPRKIRFLRLVCKIFSFFLTMVEDYLFKICDSIPLALRQTVK